MEIEVLEEIQYLQCQHSVVDVPHIYKTYNITMIGLQSVVPPYITYYFLYYLLLNLLLWDEMYLFTDNSCESVTSN